MNTVPNDARDILERVDWIAFWLDELPDVDVANQSPSGWTCGGCNPLRSDERPGSFRVNVETGGWCDFADDTKGDGPGWLVLRYEYSFPEALEVLGGYCS